jgi:transcriptional regulator with XRE-family HTH domain
MKMVTKFDIGVNIRNRRKLKGLRQGDLAKKIHITKDTISRIERGSSNYTIDILFKIADALECGMEEFCPSSKQSQEGSGSVGNFCLKVNFASRKIASGCPEIDY